MIAVRPRALLDAAIAAGSARSLGVEWIDCARGMAIVLVVLLHANETVVHQMGTEVGEPLPSINKVLRQMRMPLFYFCSGVLAHWGLARPWGAVLKQRIAVLAWVIFLWSTIYFALQGFIPVNAWAGPMRGSQLYLAPYGVLWFLYVIAFMSIVMRALRPLAIGWQVAAVLALYLCLHLATGHQLHGYGFAVKNLAQYAAAFFAAGFWTAPLAVWALGSERKVMVFGTLATVAFAIDQVLANYVSAYLHLPVALRSIPDVGFGLTIAALVAQWRPARRALGWLGSRTLEIFLFHPIFIGCMLLAIAPFALSPRAAFGVLFVGAISLSVLAERLARRARLDWLFRVPGPLPKLPLPSLSVARLMAAAPVQKRQDKPIE